MSEPVNKVSELWVGMPEFDQPKEEAFHMIRVRFADQEALDAFGKLIGQKITPRTKSAWVPPQEDEGEGDLRYYDDGNNEE